MQNATEKPSKEYCICSVCGKKTTGRLRPDHYLSGDRVTRYPRRHFLKDGSPCPGNHEPAKESL